MTVDQIAEVGAAILALVRAALYLADLLHLDRHAPKLKPVIDHIGAFLGGRKERDV